MTPDLDALAALLAAAARFPHEDDGYGGCVSCVWEIPNTEDETERVWYPCPASLLPSLIEAARREAGLREALTSLTASRVPNSAQARNRCLWCGYDTQRPPRPHALLCAVAQARALLHASAGTATGDEVGEP